MKNIICLFFISLVLINCTKEATQDLTEEPEVESSLTTHTENVLLVDDCIDDACKRYTEYVCTVGGTLGTYCDETKGDCKKKACGASTTAYTGEPLSPQEIEDLAAEHATSMVKQGFIKPSSFNRSKALMKESLVKKYN